MFIDNYMDGGYHVDVLHTRLAGQLDLSSYTTEVFDTFSIQAVRGAASLGDTAGDRATSSAQPETAESTMHNAEVGDFKERLGDKAMYTFAYPNLAINRYGPWIDTNVVLPTASGTYCAVCANAAVPLLRVVHAKHARVRRTAVCSRARVRTLTIVGARAGKCEVVFDYFLSRSFMADDTAGRAEFVDSSLASSDVVQQEDIYICESVQTGLQSSAYTSGRCVATRPAHVLVSPPPLRLCSWRMHACARAPVRMCTPAPQAAVPHFCAMRHA